MLSKLRAQLNGRILFKFVSITLIVGIFANAVIFYFYGRYREAEIAGRASAEIATIASHISSSLKGHVNTGDTSAARSLLAIFGGFPFMICADLIVGDERVVSWPAPGCAIIKKPGDDVSLPLAGFDAPTSLGMRIDPSVLLQELRRELWVFMVAGLAGGLALILPAIGAFIFMVNRPIARLVNAITLFEKHEEAERVVHDTDDEVGHLIASYNAMIDREVVRMEEIRLAHRNITDSVHYASRIQAAMLPAREALTQVVPDHFLIWQPRDIVGGDFYWAHDDEAGNTTIIAGDCTGHGVPGAFMTLIACGLIDRHLRRRQKLKPSLLLSRLHRDLQALLGQHEGKGDTDDGLEMAVCQINGAEGRLIFAGARFPLFYISNGEAVEVKPDRAGIGHRKLPQQLTFSDVEIGLDGDPSFYLASDGMIDQIGGERRRSFGKKRLVSLLQSIKDLPMAGQDLPMAGQDLPMAGQEQAILKSLDGHQGLEPRRDDVTVMGFKPVSS